MEGVNSLSQKYFFFSLKTVMTILSSFYCMYYIDLSTFFQILCSFGSQSLLPPLPSHLFPLNYIYIFF